MDIFESLGVQFHFTTNQPVLGETMCHYKHLRPFERERILFFLIRGESITKIARLLNRSKFTISRKICRTTFHSRHKRFMYSAGKHVGL